MSDAKPKPLPCRCCGRDDLVKLYNDRAGRFEAEFITCLRCDIFGPSAQSHDAAIVLWNERCSAQRPTTLQRQVYGMHGIDTPAMTPEQALKADTPGLTCHGVPVEFIGQAWRGDWAEPATVEDVRLVCDVPPDAFIKTIPGVRMATMLVEGEDCVWCVPVIEKDKEDKP